MDYVRVQTLRTSVPPGLQMANVVTILITWVKHAGNCITHLLGPWNLAEYLIVQEELPAVLVQVVDM